MRYPLNRPRVKVGFGFGDAWFDTGKQHTGEDDQATAGEPVFAPADAILYNHTVDPRWGNGIVLDCGGFGCTIWHVDHLVPDGTRVKEGQQIATIYDLQGNTHMHLSFWVGSYDESLRAGALFPGVWPDRFVEPDRFLDSHPTTSQEEPMHISTKVALIRLAYLSGLGREPENWDALIGWASSIKDDGSNAQEVVAQIVDSAEGQAWRAHLQNAGPAGAPAPTSNHTHTVPAGTTGGMQ